MSASCSAKKRSKRKHSELTDKINKSIKQSDSQKSKKKRRKEKRAVEECIESEKYQEVNLPKDGSQFEDNEAIEISLIRNNPSENEMEVEDDPQSEIFENEQDDSEFSESDEDMGDTSQSELERQSDDEIDSMKHKIGNLTKKALHNKLTRDITEAELDVNDMSDERIKELDVVVDWTPSPLHLIQTSLTHLTRAEKMILKREGILVKKGAWTLEEEHKLAKNWTEFSKEYEIKNPLSLLGLKKDTRIAKHKGVEFAMYLGRGLGDRPLIAIYQRARRLLDPRNFRGRFSNGEWKTLKYLVYKYGNKWTEISHLMDRSAESLYDYYKVHAKECNHGTWTNKEDKRLVSALSTFTGEKDLNKIHHALPWTKVAKLVRTRNQNQCRQRWIYIVSWIVCGKFNDRTWKTADSIQLLKMLRDCAYQTESDIPWHSIYKQFRAVNCFQLKSKWNCLRMRVPMYYVKPFTEVIDWLVENHLPILEQRMKKKRKRLEEKGED